MRILLIGAGGVGEAIAQILKERDHEGDWLEFMVIADYNRERAVEVCTKLGHDKRFRPESVNAKYIESVTALIHKYNIGLLMDAAAPFVSKNLFDAAFEGNCHYINMGLCSEPHPTEPYSIGFTEWMGEYQFKKHENWQSKGLLAVVGLGIDPGVVDVFARFAEKNLFDELKEIHVKDGNNITVEGLPIAFGFSVWTLLDEVLSPSVTWEKDKGLYAQPPFSEPEFFHFPEGIGPQEIIKVEHEEPVLMSKYIGKGLEKVTFKIGLGEELTQALKAIYSLGLHSTKEITVGDVQVIPRAVIEAVAADPAKLGEKMSGKMCVGIHVIGKKHGLQREVFMYQALDNQFSMENYDCQAVVTQTGFGAAIGIELLSRGIWKGTGVHGPEAFEPEPYLKLMKEYNFPYALIEMDSEYKHAEDKKVLDMYIL